MKRLSTVLICIVLLIAAIPPAAADTAAEDLTDRCSFDFGSKKETGIDPRFFGKTVVTLKAGASFSFSWDEPLPDARLCLQWRNEPRDVALLQYGADGTLLSEETLPPYPETVSPLLPDARRAVIRNGAFDLRMQAAAVYGAGELPEPFHDWQELPAHVDYLLIATHPDDDVLYLGSIVPTYGAERGYVGTIVFVTNQNRDRTSEAENGAWAMGLRVRPRAQIDSILTFVGMDKIALHGDTLVKSDPRVMLDFSSIAKGMACDEIGRMLVRNGARNWLVEIGGEVMASGVNKRGTPWQVSVDMPTDDDDPDGKVSHESALTLALDSGAVATSGNYRKWRDEGGGKLSHIIDPHTGDSHTGTLLSVTVIAHDCMTADAWATACMVMGENEVKKVMQKRQDLGVMTISADTVSGYLIVWSNAPFAEKINQ